MKKYKKLFFIILALQLILSGCGGKKAETGFPLTVGGVTIEQAPKRVVSLSPAITEQLFILGYGGRIVAAAEGDSPLSGAGDLLSCGSFFAPDAEVILEQLPDLVLCSQQLPEYLTQALAQKKIPVVQLEYAQEEEQAVESLALLCAIFEGQVRAESKKQQLFYMQSALEAAMLQGSSKALEQLGHNSPPTALWLISYPDIAVTGGTREDGLLSDLGFYNVLSTARGYAVTKQQLAELSPDYIIYADDIQEEQIRQLFKKSKAVSAEQLFAVDMTAFACASPRMFLVQFELAQRIFGEENLKLPNITMEQPAYVPPKQSFFEKLFG